MKRMAPGVTLAVLLLVVGIGNVTRPALGQTGRTVYFPEGTTREGFDEVLWLLNRGDVPITVEVFALPDR